MKYNKVDNVIRCLCNVHVLRKFKDSYKLVPNSKGRQASDEAIAIKKYDEIFHQSHLIVQKALEKYKDKEKRREYITKQRKEERKPRFEKFLVWLEENKARNIGRYSITKAINYTLNNKEGLKKFINDARIPLDNSICERSIPPL